jgi:hypothetical protein
VVGSTLWLSQVLAEPLLAARFDFWMMLLSCQVALVHAGILIRATQPEVAVK